MNDQTDANTLERTRTIYNSWFKPRNIICDLLEGGANNHDSTLTQIWTQLHTRNQAEQVSKPSHFFSLMHLAWTGAYPEQEVVDRWTLTLGSQPFETFLTNYFESSDFISAKSAFNRQKLVPADESCLFIDVSHTVDYPYNSGIQRVVRKVCEVLNKEQKAVKFFRVDANSGQPRLLNTEELARLVHFEKDLKTADATSRWAWLINRLLLRVPRMLFTYVQQDIHTLTLRNYHRLRDNIIIPLSRRFKWVDSCFMWFEARKSALKTWLAGSQKTAHSGFASEIILFSENNILLPELATERPRIQFFLFLRPNFPVKFTILVYDLIPITTPEFCVVLNEFVDYCRLFRVADRITCISESVRADVAHFMTLIQRAVPAPLHLRADLLAGDFYAAPTETTSADLVQATDDRPLILSVGTYEPRKNQISILRAAKLAHTRGHRFRLVFAGNPGWKNDLFIGEVKRLDPQNEFVELVSRASDQELNRLYKKCRFTIFASHAEGFGLPILESLMNGKPVITSQSGSMGELGRKFGGCLLLPTVEVANLEKGIIQLLSDEQAYSELQRSIRSVHLSSWKNYAHQVFSFAADKNLKTVDVESPGASATV